MDSSTRELGCTKDRVWGVVAAVRLHAVEDVNQDIVPAAASGLAVRKRVGTVVGPGAAPLQRRQRYIQLLIHSLLLL